jgi:hypothetical protein
MPNGDQLLPTRSKISARNNIEDAPMEGKSL